jgi:hypothetical protein
MSTKCTISHNESYHLYQECYENDNVWLQLDDAKDFELWHDGDRARLRVAIPVQIFRHAVEGWLQSQWGKNPSMDHHKISSEDVDSFLDLLSSNKKKSSQVG